MAEKKQSRDAGAKKAGADKRTYFRQADFPQSTLQQAQKIASALVDNFAGKEGSPPDVALAIGVSPTSSAWPNMASSSVAYGLTDGSVSAQTIKLTPLGPQACSARRRRGRPINSRTTRGDHEAANLQGFL